MKGYSIDEIQVKKSAIGPGAHVYEAEATVICPDGKEVFVHMDSYEGDRNCTVAAESIYGKTMEEDWRDGVEVLEEYEGTEDTESSAYWRVFSELDKIITRLEDMEL